MGNLAERLQQLAELHKSGMLTDAEFQAAKRAEIEAGRTDARAVVASSGAFATSTACPICYKDDQVARTGHIASSGTSHSSFSGSFGGGGHGRSLSMPTWRPQDLGDWYSTGSSFSFFGSIALLGTTSTTLAAQLAPPPPAPIPIPEGDDHRYALYWPLVEKIWANSYYCSRDGIVFVRGLDYPVIDPADYQTLLLFEPARSIYEDASGFGSQIFQSAEGSFKGPLFAIEIPACWAASRTMSIYQFAPRGTTALWPYVRISGARGAWGRGDKGRRILLEGADGRGDEKLVGAITEFIDDQHRGLRCALQLTKSKTRLVGWRILFTERGTDWRFTFVTHPSCVALDSLLFARMVRTFSAL